MIDNKKFQTLVQNQPSKPISLSSKSVIDKKPMSNKDSVVKGDIETKIQKTLLVVDNIRLQTLNTLEALEDLSREDSLKLFELNKSMKQLVGISSEILDSNSDARPGEAQNFIKSLDETRKLLKEYRDTKIQNMTLEQFLLNSESSRRRQVLRDEEIAKVITDAGKTLGKPFTEFLEENINRVSTTPLHSTALDVGSSTLLGSIGPLFAGLVRAVPEALSEFRETKSSLVSLKDKLFGEKKNEELVKLSNQIDSDEAIHQVEDREATIPLVPIKEKEHKDQNEDRIQIDEAKSNKGFKKSVVESLVSIKKSLDKGLDDVSKNVKASKPIDGLFKTKSDSGIGSAIGSALGGFFRSPAVLGLLGGALAGKLISDGADKYFGENGSLARRFHELVSPTKRVEKAEAETLSSQGMFIKKDDFDKAETGQLNQQQSSSKQFTEDVPRLKSPKSGSVEEAVIKAMPAPIPLPKELKKSVDPPKAQIQQLPKINDTPRLPEYQKLSKSSDVRPEKKEVTAQDVGDAVASKLREIMRPQSNSSEPRQQPRVSDTIAHVITDPASQLINSGNM